MFAGPSQAALLAGAARELHIRRERLIGSAAEALSGAVKSMVAIEAQCSPTEIGLTVLGAPPRGFVVPWSEASIGGYALERVLTQVQVSRIENRLAHLWPPVPTRSGWPQHESLKRSSRLHVGPSACSPCSAASSAPAAGWRAASDPVQTGHRRHAGAGTEYARERVQVENALG